MLEISNNFFSEFNDNNLIYCHWKSNEHLEAGLDGDTDLDILLSEKDKRKGEDILRKLNFVKCQSQYGSRYPKVEDWLGYDKQHGKQIHIHLHYSIVTGHTGMKEYNLPWTDLALSSRIKIDQYDVYIMEPNLELLTLYTRIGLKFSFKDFLKVSLGKYKLNNSTQNEIDWLKKRIDWTAVKKLIDIYYVQDGNTIFLIMQKMILSTRDVLALRKICEVNFLKYNRCKKWMRIKEIKNYIIINYINKWRKKHSLTFVTRKVPFSKQGITIAFLGQDGAGKTTVTTDIRKWLSWKLDVRYSYLGSGDNYHSFTKHVTHCIPPFPPFGLFKKIVLALFYNNLAKDVLSLIIKGNQYAENGGIQIFDRYPQGCYPGINDGPKIRTEILPQIGWLSKSLMFLAEKEEKVINTAFAHNPNIVFKLLLPPEESIRRKPENDINIIRKKHEVTKNLSFPESDVYIIDAAQPYNDEILQIKEIIWQHIQK